MIELVDYANLYYFRLYIETFLSMALNGFDSLDTSRYWKEALILLCQKKKLSTKWILPPFQKLLLWIQTYSLTNTANFLLIDTQNILMRNISA